MASQTVHLLVLNGDAATATAVVASHFPACEVALVNKRELREQGLRRQIVTLRRLRGRAFVVFSADRQEMQDHEALFWSGIFHRCRETAFAFANGEVISHSRRDYLSGILRLVRCTWNDLAVIIGVSIRLMIADAKPVQTPESEASGGLAYLFPFPPDNVQVGGAMSHVRGFLGGLRHSNTPFRLYSVKDLGESAGNAMVPTIETGAHLFREARILSFNLAFAAQAAAQLLRHRPVALYQRHGRYTIAGALLSQRLRIPLILEFNGSEVWVSKHWDPARFGSLLARCEEYALKAATHIMVVSDALSKDLVARGVDPARLHVNPNGVDPDHFFPDCGGSAVRARLGVPGGAILVGFVGSFSYWHGIEILKEAIPLVLQGEGAPDIRFLLIGDGPLHAEMRAGLKPWEDGGQVIFAGTVDHARVPSHLDACDVLLSPHVPLKDGTPFFGSPTKLFEYMAVQKAIVASHLEQIAQVLHHEHNALLVEPGSPQELSAAVLRLAREPGLRHRLAEQARRDVCSAYTWDHNAARVTALLDARSNAVSTAGDPVPVASTLEEGSQ